MIITRKINHKDLIHLGYYFPEKEDERVFLDAVNEELYDRINEKLQHQYNSVIQVEYKGAENFESEDPAHKRMISEIRTELIDELKRKRKEVMMRGIK